MNESRPDARRRAIRHGGVPPLLVDVTAAVIFTAAFVASRATVYEGTSLSLVWPAAGVAVVWAAAAWTQPARRAAVLTTIAGLGCALYVLTGMSPRMAVPFAVANALQVWVACSVDRRLRPDGWRLRRASDLAAITTAALAGVAASALIVPAAGHLLTGSAYWLTLVQWLIRNGGAVVVMGALGAALLGTTQRQRSGRAGPLEAVACHLVMIVLLIQIFGLLGAVPVAWAVLAVGIWAAVRLSTTAAAAQTAAVVVVVVGGTLADRGPFSGLEPWSQVLVAHAFVTVLVLTILMIALERDENHDLQQLVHAERHDAETARQELLEAVDALPDIVYIARLATSPDREVTQGTVELANRAAQAARHNSARQMPVGQSLTRVFPPAAATSLWSDVQDAVGHQRPVQRSVTLNTDPPHAMECLQVPLSGGRLLSVIRDVSDAHRREALLAQAYEETAEVRVLLHTAMDAIADGFVVHAVERADSAARLGQVTALRTVLANTAASIRLGRSQDELIGVDLADLLHGGALPSHLWDEALLALDSGGPRRVRVHHDDANDRWARSEDITLTPCGEEQLVVHFSDASLAERSLRDMTRQREEAIHAAAHDPLTGLPNRLALRHRLQAALSERAPQERCAVVFVDLDGFKAVNDTWGHAAGDDVLRAVGHRLQAVIRTDDTAARLAGDEFVLLMRHLPKQWNSAAFLDRAGQVLAEPVHVLDPATGAAITLNPAASFGVVLVTGTHAATTVDEVLRSADAAMYAHKRHRKTLRTGGVAP